MLDSENYIYAYTIKVYFVGLSSVKTISLYDFSFILAGLNAACSLTFTSKEQLEFEKSQQQINSLNPENILLESCRMKMMPLVAH